QPAHDERLLRAHPTPCPGPRRDQRLGGPVAPADVLRERQVEQRRDPRIIPRLAHSQASGAGANSIPVTSNAPSVSCSRSFTAKASTRAAPMTSSATCASFRAVAGAAASESPVTPRPTETPASDFLLLIAARQATATSKLAGSAGGWMP